MSGNTWLDAASVRSRSGLTAAVALKYKTSEEPASAFEVTAGANLKRGSV